MISREEIFQQVRQTMHELFEIDPAKIQLETRVVEDLDLDSIDALELAARIQDMTGERMQDEQIREMRKVGDVVELLHAVLLKKEQARDAVPSP